MRRARRRRELQRRRRRQELIRRILAAGALLLLLLAAAVAWRMTRKEETAGREAGLEERIRSASGERSDTGEDPKERADIGKDPGRRSDTGEDPGERSDTGEDSGTDPDISGTGETPGSFAVTEDTVSLGEEDIVSGYAVFVDLEHRTIIAGRGEKERIVPASMTKVLTLLVAAEHLENLDLPYTVPAEVLDYTVRHDCSGAGFEKDETVTVRDLMYGAILPSGADAALSLAYCVSGSHESFVDLMNEKLETLGLSGSAHFTNCVGIYEENHYCTVYDMAVIMAAAMENEVCREVLSAHTYQTSGTEQHPDGILLSNWFLRRIEDKDTGGEVVCGKTGYVDQSGSCAVSYGVGADGGTYICVTTNAYNKWKCINDHAALYKRFT